MLFRLRSLIILLVIACALGSYFLHVKHSSETYINGMSSKHLNDFVQPTSPMKSSIDTEEVNNNNINSNYIIRKENEENGIIKSNSISSVLSFHPTSSHTLSPTQKHISSSISSSSLSPTITPYINTSLNYEKPEWKEARIKYEEELKSVLSFTNLKNNQQNSIHNNNRKPLDRKGLINRRNKRKERQRNGWRRTTLEHRKHRNEENIASRNLNSNSNPPKARVVGMSTDKRLKPNSLILFPMPGDSSLAFTTAVAQSAREVF